MDDAAGRSVALGLGNGPSLRCGSDKHLAAGGADAAQRIPIPGSGSAATGALGAVFRFVKVGLLDADVFPIDVEFISDDHGEMSFDTLADLGILSHDGEGAIGGDANERGGIEGGGRKLWRLGKDFGNRIEVKCKEDASAGDSGDAKKSAAIKECGVHGASFGERCDSGGGRHLCRKHCKPIL